MYNLLRRKTIQRATIRSFGLDMREERVMPKLDVYIEDTCWACAESRRIVAYIAPLVPDVDIELRDLQDQRRPGAVFASPTYVLDGQVVYLGNPTREELLQKLGG